MLTQTILKRLNFTGLYTGSRMMFSSQNKLGSGDFKSTMQKKITKKDFMHAEMKQNPEFFKAFPHL